MNLFVNITIIIEQVVLIFLSYENFKKKKINLN